MTKYHLEIETDEGKRLKAKIFDDLNGAKTYAENATKAIVCIIYEDEPLIWHAGDHLRGERLPNGSMDWVRVPLFQNI